MASASTQPSPATSAPRRSRSRRLLTLLFFLILLYALIGFFGIPLLIRHAIVPFLNSKLTGTVALDRAFCNPFTFRLTLEGARVRDQHGSLIAGFDSFDADFNPVRSLFTRAWHFSSIVLDRPRAHAELTQDRTLNFLALLKPGATASSGASSVSVSAPARVPRVIVGVLQVRRAELSFKDLRPSPEPFEFTLRDLGTDLSNLDTRPDHENEVQVTASTPRGETLAVRGTFFADPLSAKGRVEVRRFELPQVMPYGSMVTPAIISRGTLFARVSYDFAPLRTPREASITLDRVDIDNFAFQNDGAPLLEAPRTSLSGMVADANARVLTIPHFETRQPEVWLRRGTDGNIELADLAAESAARLRDLLGPAPATARPRRDLATIDAELERLLEAVLQLIEDASRGWEVQVASASIRDASVHASDLAYRRPIALDLCSTNLFVGPFGSADGWRIGFLTTGDLMDAQAMAASTESPAGGTFMLWGRLDAAEYALSTRAIASNVPLAALGPYVPRELPPPFPPAELRSLTAEVDGHLDAQLFGSGDVVLGWMGAASLHSMRYEHAETAEPVLAFDQALTDGELSATVYDERLVNAMWKGKAQLDTLQTATPVVTGKQPLRTKLTTASVDGEIDIRGEHDLTWIGLSGTAEAKEFSARGENAIEGFESLSIRARAANIDGEGLAILPTAGGESVNAQLEGKAGIFAVAGDVKAGEKTAFAAERANAEGSLRFSEEGLNLQGGGEIGAAGLTRDGAAPIEMSVGLASGNGTLSVDAMTEMITVEGSGEVRSAGAELRTAEPMMARMDAGRVRGTAMFGDLRGGMESLSVDLQGAAEASGASASGPFAGPVDASAVGLLASGSLRASKLSSDTPRFTFQGEAQVAEARLIAPQIAPGVTDTTLNLTHASVTGLSADLANKVLRATAVEIETPLVETVLPLLPPAAEEGETEAESTGPRKLGLGKLPFQVEIGTVRVKGAGLKVTDAGATPPIAMTVADLTLTARDVRGDGSNEAQIEIDSSLGGTGRLSVRGNLNPFLDMPTADLKVGLKNVAIKPFEALTGRYVGYLVESGRMNVDVPVVIKDGKLDGRVGFNFDSFYLGEATDSPEAPDLPIKLGLDLLRDLNDQISGDLEVSGDLNDPQFSVLGIIFKAFFNLLLKAATAPFQLIGALFGGGEQDLSYAAFLPGTADFGEGEASKLDVLSRALSSRPALSLKLAAIVDEKADAEALRLAALRAAMLALAQDDDSDITALDDAQFAEWVEKAYREQKGLPSKRRGKVDGLTPPPATMVAEMAAAMPVDAAALESLATARATAVQNVLVVDNAIDPGRVTVVAVSELDPKVLEEHARAGSAVVFELVGGPAKKE